MTEVENFLNDLNMHGVNVSKSLGLKPAELVNLNTLVNSLMANSEMKSKTKQIEVSECLIETLYKNNRFYCIRNDEKEEIWMYKKGIYMPDGKSYVQEFCRAVMKKSYDLGIVKLIIQKIMADNFIDESDFFENKDINLVPVQNGLLDIFTHDLYPFDMDKKFFNKLSMDYVKNASCPKIVDFLGGVFEDARDTLVIQEIFGYLLLREYRYERAFMFLGGGRNGKSKIAELMKIFVGAKNTTALQPNVFEDNNSFSTSSLYGKLANIAIDISDDALKNTSTLKSLTGRDSVDACRKFKTNISFVNYAKMIFGANELPITKDTKNAFWERWILLEFPYTFVKKEVYDSTPEVEKKYLKIRDEKIIEKIVEKEELEGLLIWALEGLARLINKKDFSYKHSPREVMALWIRRSDSMNAFILDNCEIKYEKKVKCKDFRRLYTDYCKKNRLKIFSTKKITQILEEHGVIKEVDRSSDSYETYYDGIFIKEGDYDFFPKSLLVDHE